MKKFPVISVNGNDYLAEVYYDDYMMIGKVLVVHLFVEVENKFLWKTKTKLVKVYNSYFEKDDSEYHDVVLAVKNSVSTYEHKSQKAIEQKIYHENLVKRSEREFVQWDGKC